MLHRLDHILPTDRAPVVLVVGDLILDEYLRGDVGRISPEAPVPVVNFDRTEQQLGGAANVAHNLVALGCSVHLGGVVGTDPAGDQLMTALQSLGVNTAAVARLAGRPTSHKLRVLARSQHLVRIDREVRTGPPTWPEAVDDALQRALAQAEGLILSDYHKGVLSPERLEKLIAAARARGLTVVVDPKGHDAPRYRGAHALTPNLNELHSLTGLPVASRAERDHAAGVLRDVTGAEALLLTCGDEGMLLYRVDGPAVAIGAEAREVYDVTGAGDTVAAVFGLTRFGGATWEEAARIANSAAGVVVGKLGTATVDRGELVRRVAGRTPAPQKICDVSHLLDRLKAERALGRRVVFTNGCFDLLHAGHVTYLQAAADLGEVLVVGLNSDRSMRDLKGLGRPLVPEADRAAVMAALSCVDFVTIFDEPTPLTLIEAVLPDILVKGADYTPDQVVGREVVESAGGRLALIPLTEGRSTSGLIERIVASYSEGGARSRG